jgi:hypothetical protein
MQGTRGHKVEVAVAVHDLLTKLYGGFLAFGFVDLHPQKYKIEGATTFVALDLSLSLKHYLSTSIIYNSFLPLT